MALTVPNLDRIQKVDPKLGEAVQSIRRYVNQVTKPTTGNLRPIPPVNATAVKT